MRVTTSKSANAESFYITKSYINANGVSTSRIIKKLGTLEELSKKLNTNRDGVLAWAKEQAKLETENYKKEQQEKTVLIPFHADRQLDYHQKKFYVGGYLFLQKIYYDLKLDQTCRKIRNNYNFKYDLNAILSDLIYTRILDPMSKASSFKAAKDYLEPPSYELHDIYRALSVLASECDFIQAEVYKNSHAVIRRPKHILYYDCTNYYFEIEQEEGIKKYGKSKEHRPNPIIQMGLFTDGDGLPLAFSLFPENSNEQTSVKPLEKNILQEFGCEKFVYCSDAGLGSENIREFNHMGQRTFIVTQSIKKLSAEEREWALNRSGFRRVSDDMDADISAIEEGDSGLYYKDEPYTPKEIHQRLIITYSPKYAAYQKTIREKQIERAVSMVNGGKLKKQRRNPNDPARFVGKVAATEEGEAAEIHYYIDEDKIAEEEKYDGFYAICTDLLDDDVADILKISEGRWQIEACFRTIKTEFSARPVYVRREDRIKAHFLTCFLSLLILRILEKRLKGIYTEEQILETLKGMNFADIESQGYMPLYSREKITDALHEISCFRTDYQLISKRKMKEIQKKSKERVKIEEKNKEG